MEGNDVNAVPFQVGDIVGDRYQVSGVIGRGGMGIVYAVEDLKLEGTLRAMKVNVPLMAEERTTIGEAMTLMKLSHPHLPIILDYFPPEQGGIEILVMDYIHGQTLTAYMDLRGWSISFQEVVAIGIQLCAALSYLHHQTPPIIHRDLKPSNVMIDRNGHVTLIDFGISRQFKEGQAQDTVQLGTVGYAAPEQDGVGQSDERTDIYSLGSLFYYMASGGEVYTANSINGKNSFNAFQPDVPKSFTIILERMLHPNPQYRYPSMLEVESALKSLGYQENESVTPVNRMSYPNSIMTDGMDICCLSLSPGAGSTFLTLALAGLLGKNNVSVSAIEYAGLRPEWHAWLLHGSGRKTTDQHPIAHLNEHFIQIADEESTVKWFALHPNSITSNPFHYTRSERILRRMNSRVNLYDLSGKWEEPEALRLLKQAKFVFIVGDPFAAKWQARELRRLEKLKNDKTHLNGGTISWVANKDIRFRGRNEWLSLFPEVPRAVIPLIPQDEMLQLQWSGRIVTDDKRLSNRLERALKPIFMMVNNVINT